MLLGVEVGSSLNSHWISVGICFRFPLPMGALKRTGSVSGINLFQPNTTVFNQT